MISKKMQVLIEKGAALSAMFTEGARLKALYGAENVYDFGIGNPNVAAPVSVNETAIRILREVDTHTLHSYTASSGFPAARQKLAESLNRRYGTAYTAENIIMTTGAAGGLNVILKVLLDEGDEVLTFAPYFGDYACYVENAGGALIAVPPNPPTFQPDVAELKRRITPRTKAVILNNPNNPTGVVYDERTLREIAAALQEKEAEYGKAIYLISDEPYRELVFDGAQVVFLPPLYRNTIVAYSFSKSLSLPGDRIGYLTIPREVADFAEIAEGASVANRILGFVNAPALQQLVVAECCEEQADVSYYDGNRELLYESLRGMGYECAKPQGAFYLFVKALEADDLAFVERAKEYRLLLTPGSGFGCAGYVRISYCVARETIENSLPSFRALAEAYRAEQ